MPPVAAVGQGLVVPRFSAPKGVERACPYFGQRVRDFGVIPGFSAPKGVERACPRLTLS